MAQTSLAQPPAQAEPGDDRLAAALAAFDRANGADPQCEETGEGSQPKALLYGRRMSACLARLHPEASPELRLAARAQHLERWRISRDSYPEGRVGYLTWRRDLKHFHAERAGAVLRDLGFEASLIARVGALLRKERLKQDPESQALEDVACLVFLEHEIGAFAEGHGEEKIVDILRKTWRKMSDRGREAALGLPLEGRALRLVQRALAPQAA